MKTANAKFGRTFSVACLVASSLGVALTTSGQAMATEYSKSSGVMVAQMVHLEDVRVMKRIVEGQHNSLNTSRVVGGAVGAIAGSRIGHGNGKTLATIAGAAFGQAVGDELEKQMNTKEVNLVEFTFTKPNDRSGRVYVLLQEIHPGVMDCAAGKTAVLLNDREVSRCLVSPGNYAQAGQDQQQAYAESDGATHKPSSKPIVAYSPVTKKTDSGMKP